ncbi:MAG: hypothetical protein ACTHMM_18310 [Agriterribacter sp.]
MINNIARIGNFTSSEIFNLTKEGKKAGTWGAPALTYIKECNMERRLGRSITDETNARPLTWGKLVESRAFEMLGLEYTLSSTETDVHPEISFWAGSKDGTKEDTVIDIKCPITLKSFCQLVDPVYNGLSGMEAIQAIRDDHKDGEKYYWQLVSNAILSGKRFAELIVYMPYQSEISEIKRLADGKPNAMWISFAGEDELPFLPDNGYYKNINIIRFEVSDYDKNLLTEKVKAAGELLIQPVVIMAERDAEVNATILQTA